MVRKVLAGVRGGRYGEVLLVRTGPSGLCAEVYNSYLLNECPPELWGALDLAEVARRHDAVVAIPNGPRYWLVDRIERESSGDPEIVELGGLTMARVAVLHLGSSGLDPSPYTERRVTRATLFGFDPGRSVFELTGPGGRRYVMQSWSQAVDPDLAEEDLPGLAGRLSPPPGWSFGCRRISEPLDIVTTAEDAVVVQDELRNTYCLAPGS